MNTKSGNIEYKRKIVPDAYHGTTLKNANKITETREFKISRNEKNYLGDGVYFFEGSKWHAIDWCKRCYPNDEHSIICAVINLGKCLELANPNYRILLQRVALKLKLKGYTDITDAFVINFYATTIEPFDTVRFAYIVENRVYGKIFSGSRIADFYQLIICVRNTENILSLKFSMDN